MPTGIVRVFVSSTWNDLQPERRAVEIALQRMRETKFDGMEYFGSRDDTPHDTSVAAVDDCDIYVGILGHRYGSGIGEAEYRRARERSLPCFVYCKRGEISDERLSVFRTDLARSHVLSEFSSPDDLAARLTADLHRWLAEHGRIHAGERLYQTFSAVPHLLSQHIRTDHFRALIQERTRDFVGRDFIFRAIDSHLADAGFLSGYIVISGEPGIGKTALIAQLVKQRGYVHHFNVRAQNIRSPGEFLANVCAELIVRYELDHAALPPGATQDSGFLSQLLNEAANGVERPVVVLVDALDEAEETPWASEANCLYLPPALPEGVFFIVTTRQRAEQRLLADRRRDIYLDDASPENLADVQRYIERWLEQHREKVMPQIAAWNTDERELVQVIAEKSQGNFMYLVHVLRDMRDGLLTATTIDDVRHLPAGLRAYYQHHWRLMQIRHRDRFRDEHEAVVGILATVREPVAVAQIAEWTLLHAARVREVITAWREFLNEQTGADGERLYRVYHASFQDFLRDEIGLTRFHAAIAQTALRRIDGQ